MPRYYYLYPPHHGPFGNPFAGGDPLARLVQEAILAFRDGSHERADQSAARDSEINRLALETAGVAMTVLVNRLLEAGPPTETHVDCALGVIASRSIELAFYLWDQLAHERMPYGAKRALEARISDWNDLAKDLWRRRVAEPQDRTWMEIPNVESTLPPPESYLREGLWDTPPETLLPPEGTREVLYAPPVHPGVDLDEVNRWIQTALAPAADPPAGPTDSTPFPGRAKWLDEQLRSRGWGKEEPWRQQGPDRKTVEKILRGERVRPDVLKKLATALNIDVRSIPQD